MKNNIDFIYEYSDLNLFHCRVKVLKGKYKDLVLEFGGSGVGQSTGKPIFNYEYILYVLPENFEYTKSFENFMTNLLIDVIDDRNKDPLAKEKLDQAASSEGFQESIIKIPDSFYGKAEVI